MLKQCLLVLCSITVFVIVESRPSGHYLVKRASDDSSTPNQAAAKLLFDSIGAANGALKTFDSFSKVFAGAFNVAESGINSNLDGIASQGHKTIEENSLAISNAAKAGFTAADEAAKAGVTGFLAIPKLAANSMKVISGSLNP